MLKSNVGSAEETTTGSCLELEALELEAAGAEEAGVVEE